jgi:hypothetical protein
MTFFVYQNTKSRDFKNIHGSTSNCHLLDFPQMLSLLAVFIEAYCCRVLKERNRAMIFGFLSWRPHKAGLWFLCRDSIALLLPQCGKTKARKKKYN